jgi:hypothetical protein
MFFNHHLVGELDEIWTSPHYMQHIDYAAILNRIDIEKGKIVPYVWDPCFVSNTTKDLKWRPRKEGEKEIYLITEPNISFQKSSIVPILALEKWYRENPSWDGEVVVINGERLLLMPYFKENIWDTLDLVKHGKISMVGRKDIQHTLETYPSATFLLHQINNEYNYMTLELLYYGFPVLHNAESWKQFGYYYPSSDLGAIGNQIDLTYSHVQNMETYKAHAASLIWTHSPYNPHVQQKWSEIV